MPAARKRGKPTRSKRPTIKCLVQVAGKGKPSFAVELPAAVVVRSPIVSEAVRMADGDMPKLLLPSHFTAEHCHAWAERLAPRPGSVKPMPTDALLKGLQAADFFADEEAVDDFLQVLANSMFPMKDSPLLQRQPQRKRQKTSDGSVKDGRVQGNFIEQQRNLNEQIFNHLSPHLAHSILMKTAAPLTRCISLLPRHMHTLAVMAQCTSRGAHRHLSLCHQHTLTDHPGSNPLTTQSSVTQAHGTREAFRCDVLSACASLPHIESLELSSSFLTGLKHSTCMQHALSTMLQSLRGISEVVFQDGITTACAQVLIPVLPSMTALRHLCIRHPSAHDNPTCWFASRRPGANIIEDVGGWGDQADSDPGSVPVSTAGAAQHDDTAATGSLRGPDIHAVNMLVPHLWSLPALQSLTLAGAKPDCSQVAPFCLALKHLTALRDLSLTDCFVHRCGESVGDGLKVSQRLGGALKKLKLLESLDLQGSMPGDIIDPVLNSVADLTRLTYLGMQSVHCMSAVECPLPHRVAADSAGFGRRLAPMLSKLKRLQFLDLSECYIPTNTMGDVVDAIAGLTSLTCLQLQQVSREERFWELFAQKVTCLVHLEELTVSMNPCITDTNIGQLAESLAQLPRLQDLDLHCCRIGRLGAVTLSQHLTQMTALKMLQLQMNRIRPDGARALAECFKTMTRLQEVSLLDTDIGDEGESVIVGALEQSRGPEWQREMSLSVMEDNKELRREYFQTGLDWFERYWEPPEAAVDPAGGEQAGMMLANVEDPFMFFLMLHLMEY